jgi:hypothetical protein
MKRRKTERHQVNMFIQRDLYVKSKYIIPNRTEDYENYLRRRLASKNRMDMLEQERTELLEQLNVVEAEIKQEREFNSDEERIKIEYDIMVGKAVDTLTRIYEKHGFIGANNIEAIATMNEISIGELKNQLPSEIKKKILPSLDVG